MRLTRTGVWCSAFRECNRRPCPPRVAHAQHAHPLGNPTTDDRARVTPCNHQTRWGIAAYAGNIFELGFPNGVFLKSIHP